jgi:hypothetical protein
MQAVKIALWDEFRDELCCYAGRLWDFNLDIEVECEWEYEPSSRYPFHMFSGTDARMPSGAQSEINHDKALEKIRKTITAAVEDGLKKLVLSVLNTDNEIFAKADYD